MLKEFSPFGHDLFGVGDFHDEPFEVSLLERFADPSKLGLARSNIIPPFSKP
jgi:hypothetical protein